MWRRKGRRRARTLVARWLRAGVFYQSRESLRDELDRTHWPNAEEVVSAAFTLAVREAYSDRFNTVEVPEFVQRMRQYFSQDGIARFEQDDGEHLVRAALGGRQSVAHIAFTAAFTVCSLIFVGIMRDLHYTEAGVDALLMEAEQIALSGEYQSLISAEPVS